MEDSKNIEDQISPVDQAILTWSIRDDSRILDDYSAFAEILTKGQDVQLLNPHDRIRVSPDESLAKQFDHEFSSSEEDDTSILDESLLDLLTR